MPWDSEYVREVKGDDAEWGAVEHLLANVVDLLQANNYQFARVNSKRRPQRPDPIARPGDRRRRTRQRTQLSETEVARRLVDLARRDAARRKTTEGR